MGQALRRGFNRNVPASNLVGVYFRLIPSPEFWPLLEPLQHLGVHFELNFVAFRRDVGCIPFQEGHCRLQGLKLACSSRLAFCPFIVMAHLLGNLTEVPRAFWRDDKLLFARSIRSGKGHVHFCGSALGDEVHHHGEQLVRSRIIELRSDGPHDGQLLVLRLP